jgi:hypothetical protein
MMDGPASAAVSVPSSTFVPVLPSRVPTLGVQLGAHTLVHLQVALLNVGNQQQQRQGRSNLIDATRLNPPLHQPLTLPLSVHLHPTLLLPDAASSSFIPPSLLVARRAILPAIVENLTEMIKQVKVKKMETLRGNRVGLIRTAQVKQKRQRTEMWHLAQICRWL